MCVHVAANNYQNGESEKWIGEWMEKRKNRDQVFDFFFLTAVVMLMMVK